MECRLWSRKYAFPAVKKWILEIQTNGKLPRNRTFPSKVEKVASPPKASAGHPPENAATPQLSNGIMEYGVADEFALRNGGGAGAFRICCGWVRRAHCLDPNGKPAAVADVAPNIQGCLYASVRGPQNRPHFRMVHHELPQPVIMAGAHPGEPPVAE